MKFVAGQTRCGCLPLVAHAARLEGVQAKQLRCKRLFFNLAEKVKQYQEALKQARAQVYAEQEAARKKVLDERAALLKEARNKAAEEVAAGKERVAKELAAALLELKASVGQLAAEIARRVLQSPPRPGGPAREVR